MTISCFCPVGSNISDVFLREVGYAITPQISNWQKLTTYLGLSHSDLTDIRAHSTLPEEQTFRLLYRWREKYRENKTLLKIRLQRAGINFESLISNIPAGQTKGVEHLLIGKMGQFIEYNTIVHLILTLILQSCEDIIYT